MTATPTFTTQLSQTVTSPLHQLFLRLSGRGSGDDLEVPGPPFNHFFSESVWREIATRIGRRNYTFPVHEQGIPGTDLVSMDQEVFVRLNTLAPEGLRQDFMTALRNRTLNPEVLRTLLLNVDETTRVSIMEATNLVVGSVVSERVIYVSQTAMLVALPNLTAFFNIMGVYDTATVLIEIRELFSGRRFSELSQQDFIEFHQRISQNVSANAATDALRDSLNEERSNTNNNVVNWRGTVRILTLVGVLGVVYWIDPVTGIMIARSLSGIPTIERARRFFFS